MNAVEFVKKYGWGEAMLNYNSCKHQYYFHYNGYIEVCVADLKQIVDAWELVQSYGGLKSSIETHNCFKNACDGVGIKHSPKMVILKQAINLVEQCQ